MALTVFCWNKVKPWRETPETPVINFRSERLDREITFSIIRMGCRFIPGQFRRIEVFRYLIEAIAFGGPDGFRDRWFDHSRGDDC